MKTVISGLIIAVMLFGQAFPPSNTGGNGSGGSSGQYSSASVAYTAGTYYFPAGGGLAANATQANVMTAQGSGGTISNFAFALPQGSGTGVATLTWYGGASGTTAEAVTCAANTGNAWSCSDTTDTFTYVAGDKLSIKMVVTTATLTSPTVMVWGTGQIGPTGAAGATGSNGPSGPSGPTGTTGASGPSGPTGGLGVSGPSGPTGGTGMSGPSGPTGVTGASGPSGPTGSTGVSGPSGPTGNTGSTGAAGPSGPSGPAGSGSGSTTFCTGSASATAATCSGTPTATTYTGLAGSFKAGINSTGAPLTLNIDSLGAKNVFLDGAATSTTNFVISGHVYSFTYDGTQIQLSQPTAFPGNVTAASFSAGSSPPSVTAGTGGVQAFAEGTVPSVCPASAVDCIYYDSTQHGPLVNWNNAGYLPLVQGPASDTAGHVATYSGTNGGKIVDSGVVGANLVVASAPGAGLAHFAGSTQTVTSSSVVNADIANTTIDLTAKVTGILPSANGGTANAFFTVAGSASSAKTYTFPNANSTIPQTIASGTSAMATGAIASTACASVVTTAATGTLSTDAIIWTPNASIKALTGYTPATTGGLTIAAYPTADNVNFDVCNWSTGSLTPSALTLNWRVIR